MATSMSSRTPTATSSCALMARAWSTSASTSGPLSTPARSSRTSGSATPLKVAQLIQAQRDIRRCAHMPSWTNSKAKPRLRGAGIGKKRPGKFTLDDMNAAVRKPAARSHRPHLRACSSLRCLFVMPRFGQAGQLAPGGAERALQSHPRSLRRLRPHACLQEAARRFGTRLLERTSRHQATAGSVRR